METQTFLYSEMSKSGQAALGRDEVNLTLPLPTARAQGQTSPLPGAGVVTVDGLGSSFHCGILEVHEEEPRKQGSKPCFAMNCLSDLK